MFVFRENGVLKIKVLPLFKRSRLFIKSLPKSTVGSLLPGLNNEGEYNLNTPIEDYKLEEEIRRYHFKRALLVIACYILLSVTAASLGTLNSYSLPVLNTVYSLIGGCVILLTVLVVDFIYRDNLLRSSINYIHNETIFLLKEERSLLTIQLRETEQAWQSHDKKIKEMRHVVGTIVKSDKTSDLLALKKELGEMRVKQNGLEEVIEKTLYLYRDVCEYLEEEDLKDHLERSEILGLIITMEPRSETVH